MAKKRLNQQLKRFWPGISMSVKKNPILGGIEMNLLKRLCREEHGQGMVEYTLVMVLVALVFWLGVRDAQVGDKLAQAWGRVLNCVTSPFSCSA